MAHRKRHRPAPPPDPIWQSYEKIRRSLSQQGYQLRRSPNDPRAWRITGSFPGFYLLRAIAERQKILKFRLWRFHYDH
jgi:hypothetical protein